MRSSSKDKARHEAPARDPSWYRDAVIYQLHIKSFFDGNDDGIGDFAGLIAKLDHIAALGVDTVWLLPFYPSPRRDDGYDIASYREVHPDYGGLADARRFIREAHGRGLKVVTELVINHTSDQHPWFQRARKAPPGSRERDFYVWSDTDRKYDGTRIIFIDTEASNWTWDPVAGAYFWHRFYSHQPDLNFDNPAVLREVLAAMRFWLDLGVDGLRLDAVPYLIEREGTNNENLPGTHAILKQIRAELDRTYPGRMLLAEANQWPEDTQAYFGDGDECHMAFHFPLMPRMYMAIAQEDRFPITDILRQTPDIPEGCQWAIFLRNHDELTLEMVTDRERDYLWNTYAADRRARLNLGIRRRLAPLLDHDRRRIELLDGLLLSMPGTPVIYYGDEIGMGDNIYLGDRDGVRTPMQWSPDRNGGFSRADPARLVLPPIQDPVYGFQAVNVEAQARDPHSLLNWTRRMLGVRGRTRVFGRGTIRLLFPANRKILAFLREHEGETALCVFNLARSAQAVELDLGTFSGRVPVEMLGGEGFPPIGSQPYPLTLPPYGFFWFLLADLSALPSWRNAAAEPLPDLETIVIASGAAGGLPDGVRQAIARASLPAWLALRPWFTEAAGTPARIEDATVLAPGISLVTVATEGARWFVPVATVAEEAIDPSVARLAMARLRRGRSVQYLTDATANHDFVPAVLEAMTGSRVLATDGAEIRFEPMADLPTFAEAEVSILPGDPAWTSIGVGDLVELKLVRRLGESANGEAAMAEALTQAGHYGVPALLGQVTLVVPDGTRTTLMLLSRFVRNQGDGWSWTMGWLSRAVDDAALAGVDSEDGLAGYLPVATAAGTRLARLHQALEACGADLAARDASSATVLAAATQAFKVLGGKGRLKLDVPPMRAIRLHGAPRLSRLLIAQGDVVITGAGAHDAPPLWPGDPRSLPLLDLATLLHDLDLAAEVATSAEPPKTSAGGAVLIERWRALSREAVLAGYRDVAGIEPPGVLDLALLVTAPRALGQARAANAPAFETRITALLEHLSA